MSDESESLFDRLQKTYPTKNIPPFGSVVILSSKVFNPAWEEKLKNEGINIFSQGYQGQAFFFLKRASQPAAINSEDKKSMPNQNASFKKHPAPRFWTPEEEEKLRDLYNKKINCNEIAKQLGRSKNAIWDKASHMHLKQSRSSPQVLTPKTKLENGIEPEPRPASNLMDDEVVKEFLAAAQRLYPEFPRACAALLQIASNKILKMEY